jgi:hypothetical protein
MKRVGAALQEELRKSSTHIVLGWLLTRRDGTRLGFTSGDLPFTLDGVEYEPSNAFSGMAASSNSNLAVDNTSATALISDRITEWDLQAGLYDNAVIRLFWVNPYHPEYGTVPIRGGRLGEVIIRNGQFEAELRSVFQRLQQPFGDAYTLECSADLGDAKCKVWLEANTWQANFRYISKAGADAGIGSYVRPTVQSGFWYQCISAQGANASLKSLPREVKALPTNLDYDEFPTAIAAALRRGGTAAIIANSKVQDLVATDPSYRSMLDLDINPSMGFFQVVSLVFGYLAGLTGEKSKTTQEGAHYTDGDSFYQVDLTSQGQLVNSAAFLMPTKEDASPRSALPGTSPLTITNGSVEVTYARGLSGASEPNWPHTLGATISDGDLVWKTIRARRLRGACTAVFSRSHFIDRTRIEPNHYWRYGMLEWLTGKNAGLRVEVRAYEEGGGFALLEQMPGEIIEGDQYEVVAGCAKTRAACKVFDNIHNFRGFPDMPTEEKALATPNATQNGKQKQEDDGGKK